MTVRLLIKCLYANFSQTCKLRDKVRFYTTVSKMASTEINWENEKTKYLEMPLEEKRKGYRSKKFVEITNIQTWGEYFNSKKPKSASGETPKLDSTKNTQLLNKVSVWQGDITTLEVDCIVNAANSRLQGGGGVDGAIHNAASKLLLAECITLKHCETGNAKITGGYRLPAKYVIHTVGPKGENSEALKNCYENSLNIALNQKLRTIAFPCISTGIYGYPMEKATKVALSTVRTKLEQNMDQFDRVIFVVFSNDDLNVYEQYMQLYFPVV